MGKRIYLIRHAAVVKPEEKIYAGVVELKLSHEGITQAEKLGDAFSKLNLGKIYCSNLSRAVDTARIISEKCGCPFEIIQGLQEINLGQWDGKSFSEIMERNPFEFAARGDDIYNYKTPGGESFREVQQRAWNAFIGIAEEAFEKVSGDIMIVSHGGVNKTIISKITGIEFDECFNIKQEYGSINLITKIKNGYCIAINVSLDILQRN